MRILTASIVIAVSSAAACGQASFEGLYIVHGFTGLSSNGEVAVGTLPYFYGGTIWSRATGFQVVYPPPGYQSVKFVGVSGDGNTIVGTASAGTGASPQQAFRFTRAGGYELLGDLGPPGETIQSAAESISRDGRTIIGTGRTGGSAYATRWVDGMPPEKIPIGPSAPQLAYGGATNADGSAYSISNFLQSYLWFNGEVQSITPTSPVYGIPTKMSDDGTVVAGGSHAWRWSEQDGFFELPGLPDGFVPQRVTAMSADGAILAGGQGAYNSALRDERAYYWTAETGIIYLRHHLENLGVDMTGWTLKQVGDMSADGQTLIGHGINPEGLWETWIAFVPRPDLCTSACPADFDRSGGVDGDDIGAFFLSWQQGDACSDVDQSGGVDGDDIGVFFAAWQAGC